MFGRKLARNRTIPVQVQRRRYHFPPRFLALSEAIDNQNTIAFILKNHLAAITQDVTARVMHRRVRRLYPGQ